MSRVYTDTLEPRKPTQDITLGTAGETISVGANSINVNTVADKGGNTLWTSDGSGVLSSVNSGLKSNLSLLTTNDFSGSSGVAFTTKIDSTYDAYCFKFINIHTNDASVTRLAFQCNAVGETGYNETITSSAIYCQHSEADATGLGYDTGQNQAQGTSYQSFTGIGPGPDADMSYDGELWLFTPSGTTYVKHFYTDGNTYQKSSPSDYSNRIMVGGYINTTAAIDDINFKALAGTIDGTIKLYGLL